MKTQTMYIIQKTMVYLAVTMAILIFVVSLGFMTNMHVLLFDGTNEMYQYYKSVQVLNKSMFSIAIMYVIYGFAMMMFDLNKKEAGLFGTVYVLIGTVVTLLKSLTMFKYIPYFKDNYTAFDFSVIEDYTQSAWQFDLVSGMFLVWDIVAILLLISVVINFISNMKSKKHSIVAEV